VGPPLLLPLLFPLPLEQRHRQLEPNGGGPPSSANPPLDPPLPEAPPPLLLPLPPLPPKLELWLPFVPHA
jgi:hypothetical protein